MSNVFKKYIRHVERQPMEIKSVHAFFWAFVMTFIFTFWYLLLVRDFFDTTAMKNIFNNEQTFQSDSIETKQPSLDEQKEQYKKDVTKASNTIKTNFESLLKIRDSFKQAISGEQTIENK